MTNKMIEQQLKKYQIQTSEDEENALKEIFQEIALYALSSTDFFSKALFQGGTALRIFYQLPRFSEDLDFLLKKSDKNFQWEFYINQMVDTFELFNINPEIIDRKKTNDTVKKVFLKDSSIGKLLNLRFNYHKQRKLTIKLEIDTNPPNGAQEEIKYSQFPVSYSVHMQDLPSNFAGKCHALLCRNHVKSRDWYDFSWYVEQKTTLNLPFFQSAINQNGDWQGQGIQITKSWLCDQLSKKISNINWQQAAEEMYRFVTVPALRTSLNLWSESFFLHQLELLKKYLL